ncbi:DEAD/DEAH box helicase [Corynebacterium uberis]|uniref:DEAD/DEAH box helicase n=1 Tax=Corynebacterium TaxID=1716 RepID=UPI001D0B4283|nr:MULTISPECIES: DEAD/DEAH box helicase [Corynebacterium]MCZ9309961.1 DEAD/DEAH box helicase [Corynebacterium sp. c6VSa_13]UDL73120.1 DEAD/DEAH box helicase [Corynebacterium uberis]UDL76003.1 DEAD/DEAH box helicase [Corynebacterium uberis]UDL78215.1 DEAD/DEAH box helicase [Corynebacterium uberis]UDL80498.1 DEAD/DEAH box helicase [Corynebacterium uberis]
MSINSGKQAGHGEQSPQAPTPDRGHTQVAPVEIGHELGALLHYRHPTATCTHAETIPPRPAAYADWPDWLPDGLRDYWTDDAGIQRPYAHQVTCATYAWNGQHVVIATGTSSGKSLGYLMPVLSRLATTTHDCALYLTPTKALGSDQLATVQRLTRTVPELADIHPAPYDGDTPTEARSGIRERSRFVFSNPDMVHTSLLAHHPRWVRLLRHLRYVIIDECHTYRGIFGANVALVIARLRRIAAAYGSHPTFILASATAADPGAHAARLIGATDDEPIATVTTDTAPTGTRTVMLWEPGFLEGREDAAGEPIRRAANTEAGELMADLISQGARTLTFVRSRHGAETVALRAAEELRLAGRPDLASRVASYRAGYLAEDRRRLERELDDGTLLGVATTNALELGIDVGSLDAVIVAGFPGTVASFWQQAGRAGRRGQSSLVVFVGRDDPLDTYLLHHPQALLGRPLERTVFNPHNPYVLRGHLYCAAVERPLAFAEVAALGATDVVADLAAEGLLRRRPTGWFPVALHAGARDARADDPDDPFGPGYLTPETAHAAVNLRGGSGAEVLICDATDGRLLGTIDAARATSQLFEGAVYLHQSTSYVVDELDLDDGVALVHPERPDYSTTATSDTDIRILGGPDPEHLWNPSPGLWVANVDVQVTRRVTGYITRLSDGTVLDHTPLDLPPDQLTTRAVAYTIDPLALRAMGISDAAVPGTLHAAEHAAIGMLPLLATCDRWDLGGVSTALHADTGLPTVFVYDGHPGGSGFADLGYAEFSAWITATFEAVRSCPCEAGCPSCVQSPKCGNGNQPLDKQGAITLLGALVTMVGAPA